MNEEMTIRPVIGGYQVRIGGCLLHLIRNDRGYAMFDVCAGIRGDEMGQYPNLEAALASAQSMFDDVADLIA